MTVDSLFSAARRLVSACVPDTARTVLSSLALLLTEVFVMDPQLTQRKGHQGDLLDPVADGLPALEGAKVLLRNTAGLIGKLLQTSRVAVLIDDEGVYHPLEVLGYAVAPAVSFPRGGHVLKHLE